MGKIVKESKHMKHTNMNKRADMNMGFIKTKVGGK